MVRSFSYFSLVMLCCFAASTFAMEDKADKGGDDETKNAARPGSVSFEQIRAQLRAAENTRRANACGDPECIACDLRVRLGEESSESSSHPFAMFLGAARELQSKTDLSRLDLAPFREEANNTHLALVSVVAEAGKELCAQNLEAFEGSNKDLARHSDILYEQYLSKETPVVRKYVGHPSFGRLFQATEQEKIALQETTTAFPTLLKKQTLLITVNALYRMLKDAEKK